MHITLLAIGSRGDFQPFLALAHGLKQRGHSVRMATHGVFESFVTSHGLEFAPLEGNPQDMMQQAEGREWVEATHNPLKFVRGFRSLMGQVLRQSMKDAYEAARGSDGLIISGPSYYFGTSVAEKLQIPFVQAYAQPIHPTGDFPSALFPTALKGGRTFNLFTHVAGGMTFWTLLRPVVNSARREHLQLPPLSRMGPFLEQNRLKLPVVYGYSEAVLARPKNWGDHVHVTGYWFLDEEPGWTPPQALTDFLDAGPAPVYIGFGSMADRNPERMTEVALGALQQAGKRGILLTGWGGLSQTDLPDDVLKIDAAPHAWLFPRMAAVVHHGGAGTTAAGLRAGRPAVVVPFFGDQPFWADRILVLGAGAALPRKQLSADKLAAAIARVTSDDTIVRRAAGLGERIRAEDGVGVASDIIIDSFTRARANGAAVRTSVPS